MKDKILVTGGSGLVGGYLKQILPDAIYVSSKDFNLINTNDVIRMYKTHKPDIVVHLAAKLGGIIDNMDFPADYYDENTLINTNTLRFAYKNNVKRFIGILSSCAYPDVQNSLPLKEEFLHDGPPNKTQFSYGISKRSFSVQIEAYNNQFGTNYQYLIPCNLYGVSNKIDENKSHFVTDLVNKIYEANKSGKDYITLYGDGTPLRQFMHAKDVANIIEFIIKNNITTSFNVAPKESISIKDIAKIAIDATNSKLNIKFDLNMPNGQIRKELDVNRMEKLIPNYDFIPFENGIKSLYEFYKNINK